MKKTTLLAIAALFTANVATAQIMQQPEGTVYNTYACSQSFYCSPSSEVREAKPETNRAYLAVLVDDGEVKVYLKHPFPQQWMLTEEDGYLTLTREADGSYTAVMPQPIFTTEEGVLTYAEAYTVTTETNEDGIEQFVFQPAAENKVSFSYKDGELRQTDDLIIALTDGNGQFLLHAVYDINFTSPGELVQLPEGVQLENFFLKATDDENYSVNRMVKGAIVGNDVYMAPFSSFEDSFIHGTIEGNKVSFPTDQYLGYSEFWERHIYARAATYEEEWDDAMEDWYNIYTKTATIDFDYDAEKQVLTTEYGTALIENGGREDIAIASVLITPSLTHFVEKAATPADPQLPIYGFAPFDPEYGNSYFVVIIPEEDTEGNFINPGQLYYNMFIDGEKFVFTPDDYDIYENMTEIPATYDNGEDIFTGDGGQKVVYFYFEGIETVGVQSYYTAGGETHYSHLVTRPISQYENYDEDEDDEIPAPIVTEPIITTAIHNVEATQPGVQSIVWYQADGRMSVVPQHGLNIKSIRMADGTVRNLKVFVK